MKKKLLYISVLIGIALLVTLSLVKVRSNLGVPQTADSSDIAAVKRLLVAGAEMWTGTEKISRDGVEVWIGTELWSYHENPYSHLPPLPFGISRELPANLITEQGIRNIISISFCANALSETDVQFLGTLPNLESVSMSGDLSDSLADEIGKNLKNVTKLVLGELKFTPRGWRELGKLASVSQLHLVRTNITDECFESGTELSPTKLSIIDAQISEVGLKKMIKTDNLETLLLWGQTNISDDITSYFDTCPKLEKIDIQNANIQCRFVMQMRQTDTLRDLSLYKTNLDDDILTGVARFTNLKFLDIQECKVTEDSIPFLKTLSKRLGKIGFRDTDASSSAYNFFHQDEKIMQDEWLRDMQRKGIKID